LINFVDATNDANHYTKPPPAFDWERIRQSPQFEGSAPALHYRQKQPTIHTHP